MFICIAFDEVSSLRIVAGKVEGAGETLVPSGPTKNCDSVFDYLDPTVGDDSSCLIINFGSSPGRVKEECLAQVDRDSNFSTCLSQPRQSLKDLSAWPDESDVIDVAQGVDSGELGFQHLEDVHCAQGVVERPQGTALPHS